jgi:hypothetical protein
MEIMMTRNDAKHVVMDKASDLKKSEDDGVRDTIEAAAI